MIVQLLGFYEPFTGISLQDMEQLQKLIDLNRYTVRAFIGEFVNDASMIFVLAGEHFYSFIYFDDMTLLSSVPWPNFMYPHFFYLPCCPWTIYESVTNGSNLLVGTYIFRRSEKI